MRKFFYALRPIWLPNRPSPLRYLRWASIIATIAMPACSFHGSPQSYGQSQPPAVAGGSIRRDDAIAANWSAVSKFLNGMAIVNGCSSDGAGCYDLQADIEKGEITRIHFDNGRAVDLSAEIDQSGEASAADEDGKFWDITFDMDSLIVDEAVDKWARVNGYKVY
jgi:hypothetical protein